MDIGSLKAYLNRPEIPSQEQLNYFALQAAWGVEYLHWKQVIHRDLAARNCLLHTFLDQIVLKIADFGLSKIGSAYLMNNGRAEVPCKTMSPEVLSSRIFSSHSDVWAFGFLSKCQTSRLVMTAFL